MASTDPTDAAHDEVEEEEFLDSHDVLVEIPEETEDYPMDDDEDDGPHEEGEAEGMAPEDIVWEDNSVQQFTTHAGSVFTVSVHPTLPIAASGGEDDLGYLWDITTGEQIAKLTGHTDSVTATAFSTDGELIATGGMDGKVRLWRRVAKDAASRTWEFLTEIVGPDEVMWLRWHPKGQVLLAGSNDSTVWLWQLPSGNTMQVLAGHEGPVQCGQFTPDGKRVITGDATGALIFWDPRSATPIFKLSAADGRFGLTEGITSLAVNPSSTLAVVGGAAGGVRVVNLAKGDVVGALDGHGADESVESIAFVEFGPAAAAGPGVVATGATDGKVCVWDLATMRLRATLEHSDAVTSLLPHPAPSAHILTSASADKSLRTWDARAGTLIREHKGHQGPILGSALSLDGSKVVSAGDDAIDSQPPVNELEKDRLLSTLVQ
ncbi:hypothetical protein BOTBODRAFT_179621 [Botryobasidium botryosum FD-172 SS1]|uniref:Uncharacterized protein n=1 Tax=Botryobasidium botryosum (strain FD-172 SS1) TaxID=930990 RepID=A0A067LZ38_BOTB1|nr:hypothetical protein BOTBODRAFT_179621 [Botryobasidium botryosum FD-172 SS1]